MKKLKEHRGVAILICSFVLGIILIVVPLWQQWEKDHGITLAFGTALFIAPIIAIGIEQWMIRRIAQDVFRAAFGYHFPDDFKAEIDRIASHGVICTRHLMEIKLQTFDDNHVRVIVIAAREFENISANEQDMASLIWIDEWGIPGEKSRIIRCELYDADGTLVDEFDQEKIERLPNLSMIARTSNLSLKRGGKCSTLIEYSVLRRRNDFIYEQFTAPTRNPEIRIIEVPDDIEASAEFGVSGPVKPKLIPYRYELGAVYFSPAPMKVRWYPKAEAQDWLQSSIGDS
jgi:hypothetical protein